MHNWFGKVFKGVIKKVRGSIGSLEPGRRGIGDDPPPPHRRTTPPPAMLHPVIIHYHQPCCQYEPGNHPLLPEISTSFIGEHSGSFEYCEDNITP